MMVKISAATPIFFDLPSGCFKYLQAYQNPNSGKNKLTEYTAICLDNDTTGSLSLSCLPQLGQKREAAETAEWHEAQVVSDETSMNMFILPQTSLFYGYPAFFHASIVFFRISAGTILFVPLFMLCLSHNHSFFNFFKHNLCFYFFKKRLLHLFFHFSERFQRDVIIHPPFLI